jgi:hypothetical protein
MSVQESAFSSDVPIKTPPPTPTKSGSGVRAALTPDLQNDRLGRLSPEERSIYERIRARREQMSPVDFSLVAAIRETRANG